MSKPTYLSIIILLVLSLPAFGAELWVDAVNGSDQNDGTSEEQAFKTITYAIGQASPAEKDPATINVLPGTYDSALGESFPIFLKSYMTIRGYKMEEEQAGVAALVSAKGSGYSAFSADQLTSVTISGLTIKEGGSLKTYGGGIHCYGAVGFVVKDCIFEENIGDLGGGIYIADSQGVEITNTKFSGNRAAYGAGIHAYNSDPKITKCSFTNGWTEITDAETGYGGMGGGIYLEDSSPEIQSSSFDNNRAVSGGAIACSKSSPTIKGCTFTDNYAELSDDWGGYGGAISCHEYSSPYIFDSTIEGNSGVWGGGIYCAVYSAPTVEECTIRYNHAAGGNGGGMYAGEAILNVYDTIFLENWTESSNERGGYGGGICSDGSTTTILDCEFDTNRAEWGGGIALNGSSPTITHCIFVYNYAENDAEEGWGGGIYCGEYTNATFSNIMVAANSAYQGGGIYCTNSSPTVYNATIAKNIARAGTGIYANEGTTPRLLNCIVWEDDIVGNADIDYSDIEGGFAGEGNINADPLFLPGPNGYYYLSHTAAGQTQNSPCIDAGATWRIYLGFNPGQYTTRIDGIFDEGVTDMGYHHQPHVRFALYAEPSQPTYSLGEDLQILLDVKTAKSSPITCDLYFVMLNPANTIYFGTGWGLTPSAVANNLPLTGNMNILRAPVMTLAIPNTFPPIASPGDYTFAIGATQPGTLNFISNIATVGLTVQ